MDIANFIGENGGGEAPHSDENRYKLHTVFNSEIFDRLMYPDQEQIHPSTASTGAV
jgi:hypothetical protein